MCVCACTCYEDGGLQCDLGASEAPAHTLVGPRVPGLDLRDEQGAVGQQDHAVEEETDQRVHASASVLTNRHFGTC